MQTYSERYDFFDHFRSFSSTAIDRGIGIGRFGVEKTTFDFCTEMYGAPAKNCSGPENRDASILLGKHIANAMIFPTVCDRFRAHAGWAELARLPNRGWLGWVGWAGLGCQKSLKNDYFWTNFMKILCAHKFFYAPKKHQFCFSFLTFPKFYARINFFMWYFTRILCALKPCKNQWKTQKWKKKHSKNIKKSEKHKNADFSYLL